MRAPAPAAAGAATVVAASIAASRSRTAEAAANPKSAKAIAAWRSRSTRPRSGELIRVTEREFREKENDCEPARNAAVENFFFPSLSPRPFPIRFTARPSTLHLENLETQTQTSGTLSPASTSAKSPAAPRRKRPWP